MLPLVKGGDGYTPFPSQACWNGLLVMDPQPLTRVRFRSTANPTQNECDSNAETLFFSLDFVAMGYHRIFIDPTVRVFYTRVAKWYHRWVLPGVQLILEPNFDAIRPVSPHPSCAKESIPNRVKMTSVVILLGGVLFGFSWCCFRFQTSAVTKN